MWTYDKGTNTVSWYKGSEEAPSFRKVNVGTVTSPSAQLYQNTTDKTSTYLSGSATVSQDGTTITFTCPKFLNTMPAGTYTLFLKGTLNSLATDIHVMRVVVLERRGP